MSSLEEDVARIRALRAAGGTGAPAFQRDDRKEWLARQVNLPSGNSRVDQRVFDDLPAKSRAFIITCDANICASAWKRALEAYGGDEDALIAEVKAQRADEPDPVMHLLGLE